MSATNRLVAPLGTALDALDPGWRPIVQAWRDSAAGRSLVAALDARLAAGAVVYPARPLRALELTPRAAVKVVIVGQDPYHQPGQAEGLAFSVPAGTPLPPSLRNILAELRRDTGISATSGHLGPWARRGVLLLNAMLSVEHVRPGSHARLGWEALTDEIIRTTARDAEPKVFMLWGAQAQTKAPLVESIGASHLVLRCNHPSPLAASRPPAPFAGCGHFGLANAFLRARGSTPVDWSLAPAG